MTVNQRDSNAKHALGQSDRASMTQGDGASRPDSQQVKLVDAGQQVPSETENERVPMSTKRMSDRDIVEAKNVQNKETFLAYLNTKLNNLTEEQSSVSEKLKHARSKKDKDTAYMTTLATACGVGLVAGLFTFGLPGLAVAIVASTFTLATSFSTLPSTKAPSLQKELDDKIFKRQLSTITQVLFQEFDNSIPTKKYFDIANNIDNFLISQKTDKKIEQLVAAIEWQRDLNLSKEKLDNEKEVHEARVAQFTQKIIAELFNIIEGFSEETKEMISGKKRDLLGKLTTDFEKDFLSPIFDSLAIDKEEAEADKGESLYNSTVKGFQAGIHNYKENLPVVA